MSTTDRAFFERAFESGDPWNLANDPYEQRRYGTVVSHVPSGRYRKAYEPGCAVGELTALLAERCGAVEAVDISSAAVARAIERCRQFDNVAVRQGGLPDDLPQTTFDLIAFVEIGYYFSGDVLGAIVDDLAGLLEPGGRLIAAHWIGESDDHVLSGQRVHEVLGEHLSLLHRVHEIHRDDRHDGFVLDVWDVPESIST